VVFVVYLLRQHIPSDPAISLALEEFCLQRMTGSLGCLIVYVNTPSVIIGRNQNPLEEVDVDFTERMGIPVLRRMSGGGAVYHDAGNLNFCFITQMSRNRAGLYRRLVEPIRSWLRREGVPAEWNDRNDLMVKGRKISGNAHFVASKRMISHGTLLFDADIDVLSSALRSTVIPMTSKALPSVRSPVDNISGHLRTRMTLEEFRDRIVSRLSLAHGGLIDYGLTPDESEAVRDIADSKYLRWGWNVGKTPEFAIEVMLPMTEGEAATRFTVRKGTVAAVTVPHRPRVQRELQRVLQGCRFRVDSLQRRLSRLEGRGMGGQNALTLARRIAGFRSGVDVDALPTDVSSVAGNSGGATVNRA
jgi:lipoate-protein ligase A